MGSNSPFAALQLTSPLPSPSETAGRAVLVSDDQDQHADDDVSDNPGHSLTGRSEMEDHKSDTLSSISSRAQYASNQFPDKNDVRHSGCSWTVTRQDRSTIRNSLPPLIFDAPKRQHGDDSLYPLANIPTPKYLRRLSFDFHGTRGILEEFDLAEGVVCFSFTVVVNLNMSLCWRYRLTNVIQMARVSSLNSSNCSTSANHSPRKRPVSWFASEEDWDSVGRSSKRTETSKIVPLEPHASGTPVSAFYMCQKSDSNVDDCHDMACSSSSDDGSLAPLTQLQCQLTPGPPAMLSNLPPCSSPIPNKSMSFDLRPSTLDTNTIPPASTSFPPTGVIDNQGTEGSPNSALPSPSLSPVSSAIEANAWSINNNNASEQVDFSLLQITKLPSMSEDVNYTAPDSTTSTTATTATRSYLKRHPPPFSPQMFHTYTTLPQSLQNYLLMHLLRRSPLGALRLANSAIMQALRTDIVSRLPIDLAVRVLSFVDPAGLCRAVTVSKNWRRIIDGSSELWLAKIAQAGLRVTTEDVARFTELVKGKEGVSPYKEIFRWRYRLQYNWRNNRAHRTQLQGHGNAVVTCLQFDDDKIITGSDDHNINIYDIKTGELRRVLRGHEGGVWALQYVGNTLVTGATDRTIRVWDIETGRCRHIFRGHASTVRCLTIVMPVNTRAHQPHLRPLMEPQRPMLVSGSRDSTLRVWMLPTEDDNRSSRLSDPYSSQGSTADLFEEDWPEIKPYQESMYHLHTLTGHDASVRALAAHGNILASGSYDFTVRIWHLEGGYLRHELVGHESKVYSVVLDAKRNRCISGGMDATVRIWNMDDGSCERVLTGWLVVCESACDS